MTCLRLLAAALALGACGKVLEVPTDGTPGDDGGGDAPPDVPVKGLVKVTVLDRAGTGAVAVGIPVVFVDTDGTQIIETTDSNGKAEAEVFGGASVTAVATAANGKSMLTILDIAPGDELVMGRLPVDTGNPITFVVNWTQVSGANDYEIFGPCGFQDSALGTAVSKTITLNNSCHPATMELLINARNSSNLSLGFSAKSGINVAAGSTTMPGFSGSLGFTGSFTNISKATNLSMTRGVPEGFGFTSSQSKDVTATSSTTISVSAPTTGSARVVTFVTGVNNDSQEFRQRLAGNSTTYGLDFAATALPWIDAPVLDIATHSIMVSANNTGTSSDAPDLIQTGLSWRRGNSSYAWAVFGPRFEKIVLPELTGALADGMPMEADFITGNRVTAFEADTIDNYAAVRGRIGEAFNDVFDDTARTSAQLVRTSTSAPGN